MPTLEHICFPSTILHALRGCGETGTTEAGRARKIDSIARDYQACLTAPPKKARWLYIRELITQSEYQKMVVGTKAESDAETIE